MTIAEECALFEYFRDFVVLDKKTPFDTAFEEFMSWRKKAVRDKKIMTMIRFRLL